MKILPSIIIAVLWVALASAQDQQIILYPYLADDKYGYVDSVGNMVIEPQYHTVSLYGSRKTLNNLLYASTISQSSHYNLPLNMAEVNRSERKFEKSNNWKVIDVTGASIIKADTTSNFTCLYSSSAHSRTSENVKGFRIKYKNQNTKYYHIANKVNSDEYGMFLRYFKGDGGWDDERVLLWQPVGDAGQCFTAETLDGRMDLLSSEGLVLKKNISGKGVGPPSAELVDICNKLTKNIDIPKVDSTVQIKSTPEKKNNHRSTLSTEYDYDSKDLRKSKYYLKNELNQLSDKSYNYLNIFRINNEEVAFCYNNEEGMAHLLNDSVQIIKTYNVPINYRFEFVDLNGELVYIRASNKIIFLDLLRKENLTISDYGKVDKTQEELLAQLNINNEINIHDSQWHLSRNDEIISLKVGRKYLIAKVKRPGSPNFLYRILLNDNYQHTNKVLTESYAEVIDLEQGLRAAGNQNSIISIPEKRNLKDLQVYSNGSQYRLFRKNSHGTSRFLVVQENQILMDTIADAFISFDKKNNEAKLIIEKDTVSLIVDPPERQFYRSNIMGTRISRHMRNDSIIISDRHGALIHNICSPGYYGKLDYFNVAKLNENRYLIEIENGFYILDKNGTMLDKINARSNNCMGISTNWAIANIYGKAMLVFSGVKPFLYDFEQLKELRAEVKQ